ncbi:hypothetical protein [Nonomuraea sediminis]|uniref:hypothetical protein n=1 Tax=Nonomuraea sediminis TaxID=2835864 RepID=UPI001BDC5F84|nr:hypothetical protein [Nonomuraea sediminis]
MNLGAAHWIYLAGIVVIIAVMIMRKNIVIPAVAATFFTAWAFTGDLVKGLQSIFGASLTAAAELFNIFLIIALVTALLGALKAIGADQRMIEPFRTVMRNGHAAFWVIAGVTYVISLFFWPTPAVPLIGAILLPVAIRAGLPPLAAGLSVAIAGQGMALSSDYVMQVAPGLSAKAAGVGTTVVADRAMVLSLIVGVIALVLGYLMTRRTIQAPSVDHLLAWEGTASSGLAAAPRTTGTRKGRTAAQAATAEGGTGSVDGGQGVATAVATDEDDEPMEAGGTRRAVARSKAFAVIVPVTFAALVAYMLLGKFTDLVPDTIGGQAAALVGGVVAVLLLFATLVTDGRRSLETCAEHVVDGLVFSVKAMGIVLPIAGFFFIGNADFAARIMGLEEGAKAPNFLFDLVSAAQQGIPHNSFLMAFGILIVGVITGLDGSGFAGLPLTGSLSGALGPAVGMDPATLAAVGQMGCVWSGGGVLIAWSSLIAVAGFARVPVLDLARKAFVPVIAGLVAATLFAVIVF